MKGWLRPVQTRLVSPEYAWRVVSPDYDSLTPYERYRWASENPDSFFNAFTPAGSWPSRSFSQLVSQAADKGFQVEVVPGPSALTAALAVSGFQADAFTFLGFLPRRRKDRRQRLRSLASSPFALVLFEAPHRLRAALMDALEELGEREVALCRELTKLHEEVFRGTLSQALHHAEEPRGEYVVIIKEAPVQDPPDVVSPALTEEAASRLSQLRETGTKAKEAVAVVSDSFGLPKNLVYRLWVEAGPRRGS